MDNSRRINSIDSRDDIGKGTCRGSIYECPYVQKYQDKLVKVNHDSPIKNTETSEKSWRKVMRLPSAKLDDASDKSKSSKSRVSDFEKDDKSVAYSSVTMVRSTRAQDLRSQCNRDLMKPKSVCEKTRGTATTTSPYMTRQQQKKKRSSLTPVTNRSVPTPKHASDEKRHTGREKSSTAQSCRKQKREKMKDTTEELQREKTREVIHPMIVNKKEVDDCGDRPRLKKSQTFFICKGPKRGEGDDLEKVKSSPSASSTDNSDSDYDDPPSPKMIPLTHNDSFCLIAKSSQNWSTKKHRDDENLFIPRTIHSPKAKTDEKGILKNSNRDLKSIDSIEKIDSEKIVRFSDELIRKRKVLRKYVRRKNKLQNSIAVAWYRKNKIFQKYLQILKAKSVLHGTPTDIPENLKPFQVPAYIKERYEAEMLGLVPRNSKSAKGRVKRQ